MNEHACKARGWGLQMSIPQGPNQIQKWTPAPLLLLPLPLRVTVREKKLLKYACGHWQIMLQRYERPLPELLNRVGDAMLPEEMLYVGMRAAHDTRIPHLFLSGRMGAWTGRVDGDPVAGTASTSFLRVMGDGMGFLEYDVRGAISPHPPRMACSRTGKRETKTAEETSSVRWRYILGNKTEVGVGVEVESVLAHTTIIVEQPLYRARAPSSRATLATT